MKTKRKCMAVLLVCFVVCAGPAWAQANKTSAPPTAEEAKKFMEHAEQELFDLGVKAQRAAWVQENFITVDTEAIAADTNEAANTAAEIREGVASFRSCAAFAGIGAQAAAAGTCHRFSRS